MSDISRNYQNILSRIAEAAGRAGRNSREITLISVSKTNPPEIVEEAYRAGIRVFGENRVQEISEKFIPRSHPDIVLHMIGTLQSNKVKTAVQASDWIQSVDREKILRLVSRHAVEQEKLMNICIEVNTSGEASKHGLTSADEVLRLSELAVGLPGIRLRGLMTIGPLMSEGEDDVRKAFVSLRELFTRIADRVSPEEWDCLSMGMSNDFELAISEGATMVRVGTAIFGARSYAGAVK